MDRRHFGKLAASVWAGAWAPAWSTEADSYPNKPIRVVITYAAGTTTDVLGRMLCEKAGAALGQTMVVVNKPGASGAIGSLDIAKSPADGYNLVFAANQTHSTNAALVRNLSYDPVKDFTPVAKLASQSQVLVVNPSLGVKSVAQLVALAKSKPNALNFASTGNGTGAHLAGELFKLAAGVDMVHIPYNSSQVFTELLAGNTGVMFYPYSPLKPHIDADKLVPLATTGATRAPWLPNVPTMVESGYPDFLMSSWFAVYGPAGMNADITEKISKAFKVAMERPEVRTQLLASGTEAQYGGPADLAAITASEIARVRKLVADSKLTIE